MPHIRRQGLRHSTRQCSPSHRHTKSRLALFSFTTAQQIPLIIAAVLFACLAALVRPITSVLLGQYFERFNKLQSGNHDTSALLLEVRSIRNAFVLLALGTWFIKGVFFALWVIHGESQARVVRYIAFTNLLERDMVWFESQEHGTYTVLSRLQTRIQELQLGLSICLGSIVTSLVEGAVSLVVAFYHSWILTLILLSTFPVVAFILFLITRGTQSLLKNQQSELTGAIKQVTHCVENLTFLKTHRTQLREIENFTVALARAARWHRQYMTRYSLQNGVSRFAAACFIVLTLFCGGSLVFNNHLGISKVLTTFSCCQIVTNSLTSVLHAVPTIEKATVAAGFLESLVDRLQRGSRLFETDNQIRPPVLDGDIEIKDVKMARQRCCFIVGKSGSGKSTLGSLLLKLHSPSAGCILVDGIDIDSLDTSWLRNNVTLCQQDSFLFQGSVVENIEICRRNRFKTDSSELQQIIDFADLSDTLQALPQGINTRLGRGGSQLSGGQSQRLALARARIRDTPVLILDESTSALDEASKRHIMANIRSWRKEKTTIIITHDLSQIDPGDFVYVLKSGAVLAEGYCHAVQQILRKTEDCDLIGHATSSDLAGSFVPFENRPRMRTIKHSASTTTSNDSSTSLDHCPALGIDGDLARLLPVPPPTLPTANEDFKTPKPKTIRRSLQAMHSCEPVQAPPTDAELDAEHELLSVARTTKLRNRLTAAYAPHQDANLEPTHHLLSQEKGEMWPEKSATKASPEIYTNNIVSKPQIYTHSSIDGRETQVTSFWQIVRTIWPIFTTHERRLLAITVFAAVACAAIPSATAWTMAQFFSIFTKQDGWVQKARKWSAILLVIGFADFLSATVMYFLLETLSQRWSDKLRGTALTKVISQPKSWFDVGNPSLNEICRTMDQMAETMRSTIARTVCYAIVILVMTIITFAWSCAACSKLSLIGFAHMPLVIILMQVYGWTSRKWLRRSTQAIEAVVDMFLESFSDVRTVRALTLESHFHKRYDEAAAQTFKVGVKRGIYIGICYGIAEALTVLISGLILDYGFKTAVEQRCSPDNVLITITQLLFTALGVSIFLRTVPSVSAGTEAGGRLLKLVDLDTDEAVIGTAKHDIKLHNPIQAKNLTFSYPTSPETIILDNITFTINPGECTALVGSSGSGKSTIISLLLKLYNPPPNTLYISNHDITTIDTDSLLSQIAYVPQQPTLLPTTIRENILYGLDSSSSSSSTDTLTTAAHAAGIHDFIASLPSAYDTPVGDGGQPLSGGQAQRIALARAFARHPRLLLLDEPTSALDVESADVIRESLRAMRAADGELTVVIVTHTRSMMEIADSVVMLEKGRVVEQGAFGELMGRRGRLWKMLNDREDK